jgi:hypothetical protein
MKPPKVARIFSNKSDELKYGNGISIVFYLRYGIHSVLLPGDIVPEIFKAIIDGGDGVEKRYTIFESSKESENPTWHKETGNQPSLKELLKERGLSIYVTPHHGLESCYFSEFNSYLKGGMPLLNVISEKQHRHENAGSIHQGYQGRDAAVGLSVSIEGRTETRHSINTAEGYHYLIALDGTGGLPRVYGEKDPMNLLNKV